MGLFKAIVRLLCKPPAHMKGDYTYYERKYINIAILCQIVSTYVPAIISLFIDINYEPIRAIIMTPIYICWVWFLYKRWYGCLTAIVVFTIYYAIIYTWMSADKGMVLFFPFFFLIHAATFFPAKKFLIIGYIFVFSVSFFIIKERFNVYLQTAPREVIVVAFKKSFTTMLQMLSVSFCHLILNRYRQDNVYRNLSSLKATIAAQNEKLEKANVELTKALESRESFILSFSHETRNPLNGIMGNLHLLSEIDLSSPKAKHFLQKANICAKILNNILLTILDSARTGQSAVDIKLQPQTIDMATFIREAWIFCREIIKSKKITPILEVSPGFPRWLVLDPERLMQVVMNLVSNAVKYTQKGFIRVSFHWKPHQGEGNSDSSDVCYFTSRDTKLENDFDFENTIYTPRWFYKATSEEKGTVSISVEDTGCGISEEGQQLIFEKFAQVNENIQLKNLGLGLGLWIAKAIANLHEGDIVVRSKEGFGSCFTALITAVSKPLAPEEQTSAFTFTSTQETRSTLTNLTPLRALVVDDAPINQDINAEMLRKYGFSYVETASDGLESLNLFKKRGPNFFALVTMDLEMPVMKGKEAMILMRKWEAENNIPPTKIVVISGNAIDKEINECLDTKGLIRANAFLTKPCAYHTLAAMINKLVTEPNGGSSIIQRNNLPMANTQWAATQKRQTVLFADDDFFNIDIMAEYAQKMNLDFHAARDGEEAYQVFDAHCEDIDLILLDYNMPIMNGPEVGAKIKAKLKSISKKCPILLLSGMNKVPEEVAIKFDGIIHKPLTFNKLEKVIMHHLQRNRLDR